MEDMIKKIIDADNEAKKNESDTLLEQEELNRQIEEEAQKIIAAYMEKAEALIAKSNQQEEKKAAARWSEIEKKHKSVEIKLKSDFELNAEKWADTIARRTIE